MGAFNRRPLRTVLILCQEVRDLDGELGVPGRSRANNRKQPSQGKGTPLEPGGALPEGWEAGFKTQREVALNPSPSWEGWQKEQL